MKENVIKTKTYAFAIRIVNLHKHLCEQKREFVLSKQILRCGTSVGANVFESEHAESKNDFSHKMSIARKEINETIYWLELLKDTDYLTTEQFDSLHSEAVEILKILISIIKSSKK